MINRSKCKQLATFALGLILTMGSHSLLKADDCRLLSLKVCLKNHADFPAQFNIVYKASTNGNWCDCSHWHWGPATPVNHANNEFACNTIWYPDGCDLPSVYIYAVINKSNHQPQIGHTIEYKPNDLNGDDTLTYAVYSDTQNCGNEKYCHKLVSHQIGN